MFRCHFCQQITPPKTTRHSVVIEVREKRYSSQKREFKRGGGGRNFRDRDEPTPDRGGQGVEIMREVSACPACAAKQHEVKRVELETATPAPEATETENTEEQS